MCELFAMSSRIPSTVKCSFEEFSEHGSRLRNNRDGWGIALARDRDAFLVKEAEPATDSIWVQFLADNSIETTVAVAHVRYATRGAHTMENTHPFRRALGRHAHFFAHNGTLTGIDDAIGEGELTYFPIGDTDSELAFCLLLSRLRPFYVDNEIPSLDVRFEIFHKICDEMSVLGPTNFLYFDGDVLFAHAHKRVYEEGDHLTEPRAPGMQMKRCWTGQAQKKVTAPGLKVQLRDQQVVLLASIPLDDDGWEPLPEGTILALRNGSIVKRI